MMSCKTPSVTRLRPRRLATVVLFAAAFAALSGVAVAATVTLASLGLATRTVQGKSEKIVVDGRGVTVYELGGESLAHLQCITTTCFKTWQPVKVGSATAKIRKGSGVPGTVGVMRRVRGGFYQAMLDRHPLYYYSGDNGRPDLTRGQGITSFGGTWHVVNGS